MSDIANTFAVVMAGGQGTRLWPYSNAEEPKQFLKFGTPYSLFQRTLKRLKRVGFEHITVVTSAAQKKQVQAQVAEIDFDLGALLVEPIARGTAIAYSIASQYVSALSKDAKMVVVPVDGYFDDEDHFADVMDMAVGDVRPGEIGLVGVVPDTPHDGFGYLVPAAKDTEAVAGKIQTFVEKPSVDKARSLIQDDNALWNCGILISHAQTVIDLFHTEAPMLEKTARAAVRTRITQGQVHTIAPVVYSMLEKADFEVTVLRKHNEIKFYSYRGKWSDVGGYAAIGDLIAPNDDGNVLVGSHQSFDSKNCVVVSPDNPVAVAGLQDVIVSVRNNRVLVAAKSKSQTVGKIGKAMEDFAMQQQTDGPNRPWGHYRILQETGSFKVKEITVKPGGVLSLQSHKYRAEHWTVVQGKGVVHLDGQDHILGENQGIYIPIGAVHRVSNPTNSALVFIEVQHGSYLGEDDIERYEDIYDRVADRSETPSNPSQSHIS